jgi:exopolysaccharide biosynthesis protein YbjH
MYSGNTSFLKAGGVFLAGLALGLASAPSILQAAEDSMPATLNLYGLTGLIDMPTAERQPDGQLSMTVSHFSGMTRNTLTFQMTPRLSGSFRYSILKGVAASGLPTMWDRSFDVRYNILDEGRYRPALAFGMQDIIGTGTYSGEYLVATKRFTPKLKVTGGIGWGRFASRGGFTNPLSVISPYFTTRPTGFGFGGTPAFNQWFRGPAALFGGVEWQTPVPRLSFKAEYSSDAYTLETVTNSVFVHRSPFNFALNYRFKNGAQLSGYYLYGSEIGLSGTISLNPNKPPTPGSRGPAPIPVFARPKTLTYETDWTAQTSGPVILRSNIQTLLAQDGQQLEALRLSATTAEVRFRNNTREAVPEAIGRVARILSRLLPNSVESFTIEPVANGMPMVAVTLKRSDIEVLENDPAGAAEILKRAVISDGRSTIQGLEYFEGLYPRLTWSFQPYTAASLFDPDNPFRLDVGIRLEGQYELRPGLILSGSVRKRVVGNLNTVTRLSNSVMRHVRSDYGFYDNAGDPAVEYLMAEYFFRPGTNLYGRVAAGYLEKMYGGVSAEVLWKPVDSRFAIGAELNVVKQRAFNQLFGFQSYGVVTGAVSGYWDMGNGFYSQVDVGRYLAGDYGATVTVDRVFNNGWKVGAFFTLTNVPFSTFGEGSFDKGLRFTVPQSWLTGKPTRKVNTMVIRPITRDGGARLEVRNRLYGVVEDYRGDRLKRRWGRFWR